MLKVKKLKSGSTCSSRSFKARFTRATFALRLSQRLFLSDCSSATVLQLNLSLQHCRDVALTCRATLCDIARQGRETPLCTTLCATVSATDAASVATVLAQTGRATGPATVAETLSDPLSRLSQRQTQHQSHSVAQLVAQLLLRQSLRQTLRQSPNKKSHV